MTTFEDRIPRSWREALAPEFEKPYWSELEAFIDAEYASGTIYPPREDIFNALVHTPFSEVKALILGQDPYHGAGQAHGLCFSVLPGVPVPPSLRNIYKELEEDLGIAPASHGYLNAWAKQGILLLNAVLTVREGSANSHQGRGWEHFTDAVIRAVSAKPEHVVFVLWGGYAKKKKKLIDKKRHTILESGHPSPLSIAYFKGTRPFSKINAALESHGRVPIDWSLPSEEEVRSAR